MKLMRVGAPGAERPVLLDRDGRHLDLSGITADIDAGFLSGDGLDVARDAIAADALAEIDITGLRIGSPVARPGGHTVGSGRP